MLFAATKMIHMQNQKPIYRKKWNVQEKMKSAQNETP